ncbi:MAG: protein kinase [Polyangiaceae bacterium]|nr:protein kinase [Polyangiaceae bacterium]
MAAPPPRPSARNPGMRGGPVAAPGAGPPRAGPSHTSQNSSSASGVTTKGDKVPGTFFLGRYRVVEEIGVGGMASVHLGRMDGPGGFQKWVAIKRIHPNLVEDDQFVDMFLDEARIAAGINHANVAQVFDLGKDEGTYWIAMEYLHGEPLRELMRRCEERSQIISCDIAARVCADAAEGLHAAHELRGKNNQLLGLVHRDVTPHNLFITYEGYTKVVDFGIAKVADRLSETRAGTLKGKLAYMSPEQVRGQDDVDRTTDIFALGVVLWELTTGHRLFRMDTDLDTLEKVQACVVPPPSTIVPGYPIELETVVMKALAKKKPERYQTARELSRALQMYLQHRGVLIGPEEVSAFVRDMFADRIKAREAHLAWAADVTSTINIDQLNAMKASRGQAGAAAFADDPSRRSLSDPSDDGGPRTVAMSAEVGKPSVPGLATPPIRPSTNGVMDPAAMNAPPSRRPPPAPPTVPNSPSARGPSSTPNPPRTGAAQVALVDDDEDVPTTVATREQVRELAAAQGSPQTGPQQPGPRPAAFASIRATSLGMGGVVPQDLRQQPHALSSTIAMPPGGGPAPNPGPPGMQPAAPTFGPPPSYSGVAQGGMSAHGSSPQHQAVGGAYPYGAAAQGMHGQRPQQQGLPGFGPPGMQQQYPMAGMPNQPGMQQGFPQHGQHGQPGNAGMMGAGMMGAGMMGPPTTQTPNGGLPTPSGPGGLRTPPSAIETALSLPRPDPGSWGDSHSKSDRMSTAVLIAVAVLTAICVLALGALIYFRYRAAPQPPAGSISTAFILDARG